MHPSVESVDETILQRLARRNIESVDPMIGTQSENRIRGKCRPIITANHAGFAAVLDQGCKFTRYSAPRYKYVRDRRAAFTGNVVDHIERPELLVYGI